MNVQKLYSKYFRKEKRVILCIDNLGKGTNALNAISLILTYIEKIVQ